MPPGHFQGKSVGYICYEPLIHLVEDWETGFFPKRGTGRPYWIVGFRTRPWATAQTITCGGR